MTAISIPSLMNNKIAYFIFKMKLPRVQAMNINSNILFVLSAKLPKFAKYFHCVGPKFGTRSPIPNGVFKIIVFCLL